MGVSSAASTPACLSPLLVNSIAHDIPPFSVQPCKRRARAPEMVRTTTSACRSQSVLAGAPRPPPWTRGEDEWPPVLQLSASALRHPRITSGAQHPASPRLM